MNAPRHDYQPLSPTLPSKSLLAALAACRGYGLRTFTVTQSPEQLQRQPADAEPAKVGLAVMGISLDTTRTRRFPYGPDFTSRGFCRWHEWIRVIRRDVTNNGAITDEAMAFADHKHRCKACRDRVAALTQDLEGEITAQLRYNAPSRPDDTEST